MANNDITNDVCDAMVEALPVNSTLEYLDIGYNNIDGEALKLIIKSVRYNNTLTTFIILHYSEDVNEQLLTLQDNVNTERVIHYGDQVKLLKLY